MKTIDYIMANLGDNIISDGQISMSGYELTELVDRIAKVLKKMDCSSRVAFKAENNVFSIVLMLAAMRAHKTFCPINPLADNKKVTKISGEINAIYISFSEEDNFDSYFKERIIIDHKGNLLFSSKIKPSEARAEETYIIYTSGTEEMIKGCIIYDDSLMNYCESIASELRLSKETRALVTTSLAFDLAYTAIFPVLLSGGSVFVFPQNKHLESELSAFIEENRISLIKTTPMIIRMLARCVNIFKLESLRCIVSGGDVFDLDSCKIIHSQIKECIFYNHYGPTEATIGCCLGRIDFEKEEMHFAEMYPISNILLQIMNDRGKVTAIGEKGELVINGVCLGRYLTSYPEDRLKDYHTGDVAYYTDDGGIVICGRNTSFSKINGYRINLKAISELIRSQEYIENAICIYDKKLYICFYVSGLSPNNVKKAIRNVLARYEVPTIFLKCDAIPHTINGKIDEKKLLQEYDNRFNMGNNEIKDIISAMTGYEYEKIKNERIADYLSSIEFINILSELIDSGEKKTMSNCSSFEKFSDIEEFFSEHCENSIQGKFDKGEMFLLCGGEPHDNAGYYEAKNLVELLSVRVATKGEKVFIYTLHSSTPDEYALLIKEIFEKYHYICNVCEFDDVVNYEIVEKKVKESDIIYFGGGDYRKLIAQNQKMRNTVDWNVIRESKTIIGVCAGAGLFCEKFYTEKTDKDYSFLEGVGILNISFSPHFSSDPQRSIQLLRELKVKNNKNVFAMEDGTILKIDKKNNCEIISGIDKPCYIFESEDGSIYKKIIGKKEKWKI